MAESQRDSSIGVSMAMPRISSRAAWMSANDVVVTGNTLGLRGVMALTREKLAWYTQEDA
jgi:hypothetical protein